MIEVGELRQLVERLRKGRLVQQSRTMTCTISGLPTEVSTGEVREYAHPDAIAAADAIEWLLSDRQQAEDAMRERCARVADGLASLATAMRSGRGATDVVTIGEAWRRVSDGALDIATAIRGIDAGGEGQADPSG